MKPIHKRRLRKLANHLLSGKLGHKKFYFGMWNTDRYLVQLTENRCGYAGCAIGECPIVFPSAWVFRNGLPVLHGSKPSILEGSYGAFAGAKKFFGLGEHDAKRLFFPHGCGGDGLPVSSTRKQVARNMLAFLEAKKEAA